MIALARTTTRETEPLEVVQDGALVLGAVAAPVVVLEPDDHFALERLGEPPDVDRVHRVAQVEVAGDAGGEAGAEGTAGECGGDPVGGAEVIHSGMIKRGRAGTHDSVDLARRHDSAKRREMN